MNYFLALLDLVVHLTHFLSPSLTVGLPVEASVWCLSWYIIV